MSTSLKVLVIEENQPAAERLAEVLRGGGFDLFWKRIETAEELRAGLAEDAWDVVLFGRGPAPFDALRALEIVMAEAGVPLLVVSDALPVHRVVELLRAGATDVVNREDLSHLVPAVNRALANGARVPSDGRCGVANDLHRALAAALRDTAEALIVVLDAEGRIREFNQACQQTTGYGFDEVVGRPIWECLVPEAQVEAAREVFHAKLRSGAIKQFEADWLAKDGSIRRIRWSNSSVREAGGARYNLGIGIDVTEQRRAERALRESQAKLRAVAENLPAAIYFKHTDGRIVVANKRYEQWYGVSGGAFGKTVHDIFPKAEADVYAAQDREVLDTAKEIERETYMRLATGEVRCYLVIKFPIFGADGRLDGIGGINLDISQRKKAEDALRESETRIRDIADSFSSQISYVDKNQRYRFNNKAYEEWFGVSKGDCYGKRVRDVLGMENYLRVVDHIERALSGERVHFEYVSQYRNRERHADVTYIPNIDEDGSVMGFYALVNDVTERRQAEESVRKLSRAVQQSPASVLITDTRGSIEYVNPKFVELTGYAADEVVGKNPRLLKSGFVAEECYDELWKTISSGREWRGELLNRKKDGEVFWEFASISPIKTADGEITHFVAVKEDITVRKEYEERLLHQASFDDLTGLPNRLLTLDRLDQAIARAKRGKQSVALAFIDLDEFKAINDSLGHSAGDELLVEAAHRLTASVRAGDTVGRLGGDEFVVVLPDLSDGVQSRVVADKILAAFRKPYSLEEREVQVTVSIGASVFPSDGENSNTLLRNADAAMYQAKAAGRNTFRFFAPQIDRQVVKRTDIELRLRHALKRNELFVVYHPLLDLRSGKLVGAEALVRWNHPDLGLVSPDYFIPVAENDGLIGRLGEFVLRTACEQSRTWQQRAGTPMRVAVNVSSRQVQDNKLVEVVSGTLRDNQLTPDRLELEITESVLVDDAPQTIGTLEALSGMGIHFSVDDFGTGYSSISYLKRFPINTLKIDRSFVRDITTNPADAALAIAMIGMAHSLGMEVVAEGVETEEQLTFLRFHGCDLAQGYYFTRPMAPEEFAKYIDDRVGDREPLPSPSPLPR